MKTEKIIQLILAILLFGCLANMPYGYYQFVRIMALVGFSILAFATFNRGDKTATMIFIALALLFQPIYKISFGRDFWNIVDVVTGAWLMFRVLFR